MKKYIIQTLGTLLFLLLCTITSTSAESNGYVVLSWNDLGMHCYNRDFQDLAVLPPYNTLWAQVVKVGDPPQIITNGITVTYSFPDNTYSVGKSNFWDYDLPLFGVDLELNVGLTGKGLSGTMDLHNDHFVAEGIPLTEYRDGDLINRYPYQFAEVIVKETLSGTELARLTVVAPVSTEMRCDSCHYDGALEDIATGRVETNILSLHDKENATEYPPGHTGALMDRRPILCAECHASNALNAPGVSGLPNLSKAIHEKHADKVSQDLSGCYKCHPGSQTKCLRGVMAEDKGMDCIDCHGTMKTVSRNPSPWLNEPRCDSSACHGSGYAQDQPLYRMSKDHGGIYCEACHDSPHAIAPSREPNDAIKFVALQGYAGTLEKCTVCHSKLPTSPGPHGVIMPQGSPEPRYRLYNPNTFHHHYTTDANEYNVLGTIGWIQEGADGYVFASQVSGSEPLYRLYNPNDGLHHWTMDSNEKTVLVSYGFIDEGIACYVFPQ